VSLHVGLAWAELGHSGRTGAEPWSVVWGRTLSVYWGHEFDLLGSCDVIGHVTISSLHTQFSIGGPLELSLYLTVFEIFNMECNAMVDRTLIRPLNKCQGHLLWYQSISHIRLPIGCQ